MQIYIGINTKQLIKIFNLEESKYMEIVKIKF